ncbi:MAG TPA: GDP-mannose 4,6-dehydratase [Solirubrobacteraceae bacterium]|nr:GDP-mannose 4,6-dehydratase [Solirubrobacteraceae bacterium]
MSGSPTALITGINGQDGSFLAELLLDKGYEVTGWSRAGADGPLGPSEHLRDRIALRSGDLLDFDSLRSAVLELRPSEIYHLAAPSFVPTSWTEPAVTMVAIAGACGALLEAVRDASPASRVFVAASGSIYGEAPESPQNEQTPCRPTNPYAIAKLAAHQLVGAMRRHDGLHASSGIVFNHESERRPERFVTRRISRAAAAIALGLETEVTLGSLDAVRDWSFAGDVMYGAWLMLQQREPGDYVLASGVPHTVAELAETAFACVDLVAERHIRIDETLVREPERTHNVGDPTLARTVLGWRAELGFEQLVERMVRADMRELEAVVQSR